MFQAFFILGACRVPVRSLHFFHSGDYHGPRGGNIKPAGIFESFPFLNAMPREARDELAARSFRKSLSHKQVLVSGGGDCQYPPFVLRGTLRVYKVSEAGKELTLHRIDQGESCILSATPAWKRFVFGIYQKRLDMLLTLVEEVAFHHVDARVSAYLAGGAQGEGGTVSATHQQIASEVGTSREVVSRILRDLEAEGGRIRILDRPRLSRKSD